MTDRRVIAYIYRIGTPDETKYRPEDITIVTRHPPPGGCPTCAWPSRETVDMICQTCGTDYNVNRTESEHPVSTEPQHPPARVLVDDVVPHAVDTTGLTEYRVTFGSRYRWASDPAPVALPEAHPDGWLAIFAPDETAARDALWDRLPMGWADIVRADDEAATRLNVVEAPDLGWLAMYPRGELARWVITEPRSRGC